MTDETPIADEPQPETPAAAPAAPASVPVVVARESELQRAGKVIANPKVRKAIYGVAAAIGALLVVLGVVTQDELNAWLELAGNIVLLGSGVLAAINTRTP